MKRNCSKCYTVLERTPVREVTLEGAKVTVVHQHCPCCERTYDDDYDVTAIVSDPAAWAERRRAQQRASQQRHYQKLHAAFRAASK